MNKIENETFFLPLAHQIAKFATESYDPQLESIIVALFVDMRHGHACKKLSTQEKSCLLAYPKIVTVYLNEIQCVTPLVIMGNFLYLHRYFIYEQRIASHIMARCLVPDKPLKISISDHGELDFQHLAQTIALSKNFSIITGGPGTGKTTTVLRLILQALELNPTLEIAMCAPTGKAQSRMKESVREEMAKRDDIAEALKLKILNISSFTLHHLLGYKPYSTSFKFNSENMLPYQMIVVDECSMISLPMMSKLLDAVDLKTQLIFLGDKEQLPSVEAGSLFADMCALAEVNAFSREVVSTYLEATRHQLSVNEQPNLPLTGHVIELQKNYRFKHDEAIGILAKMIKFLTDSESVNACLQSMLSQAQDGSFSLYELSQIHGELNLFLNKKQLIIEGEHVSFSHLGVYVQEATLDALDKVFKLVESFKILSAVRQGIYGVEELNDFVKKSLKMSGELPVGAPVMIRENAPEKNLFNGDVGVIWLDQAGEKRLFFRDESEDRFRSFSFAQLPAHELCFAMTIHQSQGSGFEFVCTVLPKNEHLTRELIYTALTRAKKHFMLFSQNETLKEALSRKVMRYSGLAMYFLSGKD